MEKWKTLIGDGPMRVEEGSMIAPWEPYWEGSPRGGGISLAIELVLSKVAEETLEEGETRSHMDWNFPTQCYEKRFLRGVTPDGTALYLTLPTGREKVVELDDEGNVEHEIDTASRIELVVKRPANGIRDILSYLKCGVAWNTAELRVTSPQGEVTLKAEGGCEVENLVNFLTGLAEEPPAAEATPPTPPARREWWEVEAVGLHSILRFAVPVESRGSKSEDDAVAERLQQCIGGRQADENFACYDGTVVAGITGSGRIIAVKSLNSGGTILEFTAPDGGSLRFASEVLQDLIEEGFGRSDTDCLLLTKDHETVSVTATVWSLYDQAAVKLNETAAASAAAYAARLATGDAEMRQLSESHPNLLVSTAEIKRFLSHIGCGVGRTIDLESIFPSPSMPLPVATEVAEKIAGQDGRWLREAITNLANFKLRDGWLPAE